MISTFEWVDLRHSNWYTYDIRVGIPTTFEWVILMTFEVKTFEVNVTIVVILHVAVSVQAESTGGYLNDNKATMILEKYRGNHETDNGSIFSQLNLKDHDNTVFCVPVDKAYVLLENSQFINLDTEMSTASTKDEKSILVRSAHNNTSYQMGDQRNMQDSSEDGIGCCGCILMGLSYLLVGLFFPFSLCMTIKIVTEYERAVIFRLGRVLPGGAKGPGMFFILPCLDEFKKVDLRTVSYDVPPQEILTKDSVTVAVDAVIYSRIFDPTMSVCNVENADSSTRLLAATTLRNVLGTKNMSELLTERDSIAHQMQSILDESTDPWGIKVERVEIKDVRLPVQLQRAMAAEAEASREARAKVLAAEGEQRASRALKEAADIMAQSPAAIQLRYLQTLNSIAAERNSTIIFPLPMDLLSGFGKK
ncbi:STOM [Mytilus coruscus]|uniref:STOM n=1 Tax=Mytilus coruscus TaxID=42192 RepID=A0A6J8DU54_MYTCO|nr:STOM [Mytilus coruscus]